MACILLLCALAKKQKIGEQFFDPTLLGAFKTPIWASVETAETVAWTIWERVIKRERESHREEQGKKKMFTSVSLAWTPAVGRRSCLARCQRRCWAGSSASTPCGLRSTSMCDRQSLQVYLVYMSFHLVDMPEAQSSLEKSHQVL